MTFASPEAFVLLIFLPFFIEELNLKRLLSRFFKNRPASPANSINHSFSDTHSSLPKSFRQRTRNPLLSLLAILAFILSVFSLARPQSDASFTEVEASGRDIMMILDISRSMHAMDFHIDRKRVNRLQALKKVVVDFIEKRKGDRMGLVVFGDQAYTQCPLTLDHKVLSKFVEDLEIGMAGNGTAIGSAIAIGLKRLKKIESESKVAVLVTDGQSNSGKLKPDEAAKIAKELDVKIYTIGIGSDKPAPFPVQDLFGRTRFRQQRMEFDEATLQSIASVTGAKYFRADNLEALENIYAEIDKIEERVEKAKTWVAYEEHFLPYLTASLLLFSIFYYLKYSFLLRVP